MGMPEWVSVRLVCLAGGEEQRRCAGCGVRNGWISAAPAGMWVAALSCALPCCPGAQAHPSACQLPHLIPLPHPASCPRISPMPAAVHLGVRRRSTACGDAAGARAGAARHWRRQRRPAPQDAAGSDPRAAAQLRQWGASLLPCGTECRGPRGTAREGRQASPGV